MFPVFFKYVNIKMREKWLPNSDGHVATPLLDVRRSSGVAVADVARQPLDRGRNLKNLFGKVQAKAEILWSLVIRLFSACLSVSATLSEKEGFNFSFTLHVFHHITRNAGNHQVHYTQHQDLKHC